LDFEREAKNSKLAFVYTNALLATIAVELTTSKRRDIFDVEFYRELLQKTVGAREQKWRAVRFDVLGFVRCFRRLLLWTNWKYVICGESLARK
jgi:hypothetical protein